MDTIWRIVYAFDKPVNLNYAPGGKERTDDELFIVATDRPPLPALKKIVSRHGDYMEEASNFRVLSWAEVAPSEVQVGAIIINYDDEREEEA
jgi:hypothetical protein